MKQQIRDFEAMAKLLKDAIVSENPQSIIETAELVSEKLLEHAEELKTVFKVHVIVKGDRLVAIKSSEAALVSKELKLEKHKIEGVTVYTDHDKALSDSKEIKDSKIISFGIPGKTAQQSLELDDVATGQIRSDEIDEKKYSVGGIKKGLDHAEKIVYAPDEQTVIKIIKDGLKNYVKDFESIEYYTKDDRVVVPVGNLEVFIAEKEQEFADQDDE